MATTVHRPGQINLAGDVEALNLAVAANRVMLAYESAHIFRSRSQTETVPEGAQNVQFDAIGDAATSRREVGVSILEDNSNAANDTPSRGGGNSFMNQVNMGKRDVFLDRPAVAPAFIDDFEAFTSHLDNGGRTPLLGKLGYAVAKDSDIYGYRLVVKAAAPIARGGIDWANSDLPDEFHPASDGQNFLVDANAGVDGSTLLDMIRQLMEQWDDDEVPDEGRHVGLNPARYNLLVNNQDLLNRDFGGQNGIFSDGVVFRAWGAELIKVKGQRLPTTDTNGTGGGSSEGTLGIRGTNYNVEAENVVAVAWQDEAVARAEAGGMTVMVEDLRFEYGGVGIAAEAADGYECFRPLGVGAISTAA